MRFLLPLLLLLVLPLAASAHAVGIEAKLKGGTVSVEAFYDDDSPAADAKITVEDESKKLIAEGTTDAKGAWSFPRPRAGQYTVRLDAGFGHAAKTTISIPELPPPENPEAPISISEGPSRETFTGWTRVFGALAGLGMIAGVTALFWWRARVRGSKTS